MPIAKEPLRVGFTLVANPDTYVPKSLVDKYDWKDKVDDGPDMGGTEVEATHPGKGKKAS